MDTPPLLYKSVHVTFVFWVPKTPPTPYMSGTFVLAPPPPPFGVFNLLALESTSGPIYLTQIVNFQNNSPTPFSENK